MLAAQTTYQPLQPGTLFCGRYEVVRVVDAGGMGVVYEVVDIRTKRHRALKTIHSSLAGNPEIRARFDLEATVTAGIKSDHLVEVLDSGLDEASGMPYLVMELLQGGNLASLLKQRSPCTPDFVVACLQQVAWALDKMHEAGVVHRDLKPENLILTVRDDGSPQVKIIDFGIVKVVTEGSGAPTTRNVGTPCYMSPEQIRGDGRVGKAADLYALGHIAFALLTGQAYWEIEPAYQRGPVALLARILQGGDRERATDRARRIGASLPTAFDAWFNRATAYAAGERHGSATQLVNELADVLGMPLPNRSSRAPSGAGHRSRGRGRTRRLVLSIGAAAILLLTLGFVWSHSGRVGSVAAPSRSPVNKEPSVSQPTSAASETSPASVVASSLTPASTALVVPVANQRSRAKHVSSSAAFGGRHAGAEQKAKPQFDPTDER